MTGLKPQPRPYRPMRLSLVGGAMVACLLIVWAVLTIGRAL